MREWHKLEFVPNHATNPFKHFPCVTDILIDGVRLQEIREEEYKRGFKDALTYMQQGATDLSRMIEKYREQ